MKSAVTTHRSALWFLGPRGFRQAAAAAVTAFAILSGGCFTFTPQVDLLADQIDQDLSDTRLDRREGAKAGRLSLGLARSIARLAIDEDEEPEAEAGLAILSGIKRVEYRRFDRISDGELEDPANIDLASHLGRRGWSTVARVVGDDSLAWVMVRFDERHIRSAVVVVLDEEELNLVRVSGRLDRVLVEALRYARRQVEQERESGGDWQDGEGRDDDWDDGWGDDWRDWEEGSASDRRNGCAAEPVASCDASSLAARRAQFAPVESAANVR